MVKERLLLFDIFQLVMGLTILSFMGHWILIFKGIIWFGEFHLYEPNLRIAIIEGILATLSFSWFLVIFFHSCKNKIDKWIESSHPKRLKK